MIKMFDLSENLTNPSLAIFETSKFEKVTFSKKPKHPKNKFEKLISENYFPEKTKRLYVPTC